MQPKPGCFFFAGKAVRRFFLFCRFRRLETFNFVLPFMAFSY